MGLGVQLNFRVTHFNERSCSPKQAIYPNPEEDVELNVGGEIFSAKVADLTRISGTMLDRMLDQIWMRSLGPEPMFIDRDSKYFGLIVAFLSTNNVKLPHSDTELAAIVQEAELLFSPNQVCYLCGAETKDFHGLYKSLFDFPRDFSYVIGEIDKVYGDCCCCDVRFGKSSFVFHIPAKMLRLAE
ncbi:K+ channel tetramerization domain protein [Ancylostoma caninum]|uniref:K+ channel tetramerization domain protein n=1 Tax=Ancylostoma caninum TaxID=29170 RepID=A0A368H3V8_ANCCA|nr:K+ channel tetramerization domain protein [Ancylostoma caninum]